MTELPASEWVLQDNGEIHVRVQHEQIRPWTVATDVVDNGDGSYNAHVHYEFPPEEGADESAEPLVWDADVKLLGPVDQVAEGGTVEIGVDDSVGTEDVGPGGA